MTDSNIPDRTYASVDEVATHFGVSVRTVRRWLKDTNIPYRQPGGPGTMVRFDLAEVDTWAARGGAAKDVA